jgi:hypothetical protein
LAKIFAKFFTSMITDFFSGGGVPLTPRDAALVQWLRAARLGIDVRRA